MLKSLLVARGVKVTRSQISSFLDFIEEVCPWFPRDGTINIETWNKVGERLQGYHAVHGPEKVPIDTFTLWTLIKECLRGDTGDEKWQRTTRSTEKLYPALSRSKSLDHIPSSMPSAPPPSPPQYEQPLICKLANDLPPCKPPGTNITKDILPPDDWGELEKEAAEYHRKDLVAVFPALQVANAAVQTQQTVNQARSDHLAVSPAFRAGRMPPPPGVDALLMQQSPMQLALKEARKAGETIYDFSGHVFPVIQSQQANGNTVNDYEPIPFKQLKELKAASTQYGPTAPFTMAILETVASNVLPPADWRSLAKAVLTGGEYLLWMAEYSDQCGQYAQTPQCLRLGITYEQLAGAGDFAHVSNQLNFRPEVYDYIRQIGLSSWKKLPKSGVKKEELTKIRQGSDEPYEEFVARLLQVSARLIEDSDAALILVKELAFENANSICQATLRPWKGKATLNDYVRLCSEIGPAYVQGVTLAAALKGQSIEQAMAILKSGNKQRVPGPPGSCYTCGKMGHVAKECKNKSAPFKQPNSKDPGICPKCKKGKHWANECHSRRDKDGNLLVNTPGLQGNERMGQPRAQKTKRGIFPVSETDRNTNPFQTLPEQLPTAPDWTSVPPPTSY
ncbi:endogenous retrovirus group K member 5 Gag polyprotein-like [Lagopus muta]|uniref:endogenous retrovirus group K member 5 Gag polyprotein-like n=1 Tax=Lagopus muta TaxID=64668 RepID=UPI00209D9AE1|nr:endogenous retrovirus group K member 5 Gag polyprotein-like [Lagopus muta]